MKALLLAAGYGNRLKPITNTIPKCLVKINGKPLLNYWLDILNDQSITEILINTHYLSNKVNEFINNYEYNNKIKIIYEEELLGTAGTLLKNKFFFENQPLILIHADNLSKFELDEFINKHKSRPSYCDITMMTFITDEPENCGIVEICDEGVVRKFYEKIKNPPGNLANGAVYIIEPSIFEFLTSLNKDVIDFSTEVLPHYIGKIFTYNNKVYHRDIGSPESYKKAQIDFYCI